MRFIKSLLIGRQRPETSARTFGLRSFCSVSVLRGTYLNRGAPGAHLQISSRKEETCAAFYRTHSGTASAAAKPPATEPSMVRRVTTSGSVAFDFFPGTEVEIQAKSMACCGHAPPQV